MNKAHSGEGVKTNPALQQKADLHISPVLEPYRP